jgi:hypothetical protein
MLFAAIVAGLGSRGSAFVVLGLATLAWIGRAVVLGE